MREPVKKAMRKMRARKTRRHGSRYQVALGQVTMTMTMEVKKRRRNQTIQCYEDHLLINLSL
jgi:hypothetical protein